MKTVKYLALTENIVSEEVERPIYQCLETLSRMQGLETPNKMNAMLLETITRYSIKFETALEEYFFPHLKTVRSLGCFSSRALSILNMVQIYRKKGMVELCRKFDNRLITKLFETNTLNNKKKVRAYPENDDIRKEDIIPEPQIIPERLFENNFVNIINRPRKAGKPVRI